MIPYDLPPKYLKALGSISVGYVSIERMMMSCIASCTPLSAPEENALFGGDGFNALRVKLWRIINTNLLTEKDLLARWKDIDDQLDDIRVKRNTYTHSFFSIERSRPHRGAATNITKSQFVRNIAKRFKSVEETNVVEMDDLNQLIDLMRVAIEKLWDFNYDCYLAQQRIHPTDDYAKWVVSGEPNGLGEESNPE